MPRNNSFNGTWGMWQREAVGMAIWKRLEFCLWQYLQQMEYLLILGSTVNAWAIERMWHYFLLHEHSLLFHPPTNLAEDPYFFCPTESLCQVLCNLILVEACSLLGGHGSMITNIVRHYIFPYKNCTIRVWGGFAVACLSSSFSLSSGFSCT